MPRGGQPVPFEQTRRCEILSLIRKWAGEHNTLPSKYAIYYYIVKPEMPLSETAYRFHFDRLQSEGYLRVDAATGAVSICKSKLILIM